MSSAAVPLPPGPSPEPVFRLSVEQYHAMIDAGVLTEDDPVELIEGILVFKMPKSPKHRIAVAKLDRALRPLLPQTLSIQLENPITLPDGEPEPDVVVFQGLAEDYPNGHPHPAAVECVIEVSDSTLRRDRGVKLISYARSGIQQYWIVDLIARTIELYSQPTTSADPSSYATMKVFSERDSIPLDLSGKTHGSIPVASVLP